jgi:hypothetical protein
MADRRQQPVKSCRTEKTEESIRKSEAWREQRGKGNQESAAKREQPKAISLNSLEGAAKREKQKEQFVREVRKEQQEEISKDRDKSPGGAAL